MMVARLYSAAKTSKFSRQMLGKFPLAWKMKGERLLCMPWWGMVLEMVFSDRVPAFGLRIDTSSHVVTRATKSRLFWGFYESTEAYFVREFLRADLDVVELGSSLGVISSLVLRKMRDSSRLITVEANPFLIDVVRRNLQLNAPDRSYTILQKAVDYQSHKSRFVIAEAATSSKLAGTIDNGESANLDCVVVDSVTLAAILNEYDIGDYALVADIEGAEIDILRNDIPALDRCQQIIIELHTTTRDNSEFTPADMIGLITQRGFLAVAHRANVFVFERPK